MIEEVEEEDEGANKADGAEENLFVGSSSNEIAGTVHDALTLTACLWAPMMPAKDEKKRPSNSYPEQSTLHGKNSSKLHPNPMTTLQLKDCGVVLLQSSMERIEIGSRCFPAILTMRFIMGEHICIYSWA